MFQTELVSEHVGPKEFKQIINGILENMKDIRRGSLIDIKYTTTATGSNNDIILREALILYEIPNKS